MDSFWFSGLSEGKLGELKVEVKENCQILSKLSPDRSVILLKAIKAVMKDRNLFQELTQKVSKVLLTDRIYKYRDIHDHTSCPRSHLSCATTIQKSLIQQICPVSITIQRKKVLRTESTAEICPEYSLADLPVGIKPFKFHIVSLTGAGVNAKGSIPAS